MYAEFSEAYNIPLEQIGWAVSYHHFIHQGAKRGYN